MHGSAPRVTTRGSRTPAPSPSEPPWALVLGGGGTVGVAWHAGTLAALEEAGLDPRTAGLVVGTSAGAVVAGYLAAGHSPAALADAVAGRHPTLGGLSDLHLLRLASRGPIGLARRAAGVTLATSRLACRWATIPSPRWLSAALPGGFCDPSPLRGRLAEDLTGAMPAHTRIVTFDLVAGQRYVAGARTPDVPLATAVAASCCLPGIFPAVQWEDRMLVDGGVGSFTHADLAADWSTVVVASPVAFDPADGPSRTARSLRRVPGAITGREIAALRDGGSSVTWLRPSAAELALHGASMLRTEGLGAVVDAAYETMAARLADAPAPVTLAA